MFFSKFNFVKILVVRLEWYPKLLDYARVMMYSAKLNDFHGQIAKFRKKIEFFLTKVFK